MLEIEQALQIGVNLVAESKGDLGLANRQLIHEVELVLGLGIWTILLADYAKNHTEPEKEDL